MGDSRVQEVSEDEPALDLGALRELCAAATEGPWYATDNAPVDAFPAARNPSTRAKYTSDRSLMSLPRKAPVTLYRLGDIDFIVAARSALPALIAEVERLTAERDRARDIACHLEQELALKDQALDKIAALAARWKRYVDEFPGVTPAQAGMDVAYIECANDTQRILSVLSQRILGDEAENHDG